ncbi:hypothetical protein GA0061098_106119 [Bradyrhizobium shewense]|uniref:Uncharacterized protein n=1 Tax=Bradyrhizobium shewense TaxID=1761772 RepID=A0A1C3XUP5_9BRAD|nr:hypothetical protein GA0061098_106119 [Bradyrhizobium shewense]
MTTFIKVLLSIVARVTQILPIKCRSRLFAKTTAWWNTNSRHA